MSSDVPQSSVFNPLLFTLDMKPSSDIFNNYNFNYSLFVNDVQFYITFGHDNKPDLNKLPDCLNAVERWLCRNKLKVTNLIVANIINLLKIVSHNSVFEFLDHVKNALSELHNLKILPQGRILNMIT